MPRTYDDTSTHITNLKGRIRVATSAPTDPLPLVGDEYFDTLQKAWFRYTGDTWIGFKFTAA